MTRRQDLDEQRRNLGEIREIMSAMKNLAYLETRKLDRYAAAQQAVVSSIAAVAADFAAFHADALPDPMGGAEVYLLIGSERGFCRDFNRRLLDQLESRPRPRPDAAPILIAVGQRLQALLENERRPITGIRGASVAEELPAVLPRIARELAGLLEQHRALVLYAIHHSVDQGLVCRRLLPPDWQRPGPAAQQRCPPLLQLAPAEFALGLTEQYLLAALQAMLCASLLAENLRRVAHLDGAVRHLDQAAGRIAHRCATLRQEEIIEEIEVILLSAASVAGDQWRPGATRG